MPPLPTSETSLSPFLHHLPLEIRRHIYSYLVPTLSPSSYWAPPNPKELRHDSSPCSASLLRVNRQIHAEVMEEWYFNNSVQYKARIKDCDDVGLYFLGQLIPPGCELPRVFREVKNLGIFVRLHEGLTSAPPRRIAHAAILNTCFPAESTLGALKKLEIELFVSPPVFSRYCGRPDEFKEFLGIYLEPFGVLKRKGLREFGVCLKMHPVIGNRGRSMGEEYLEQEAEFLGVVREKAVKLERDLVCREGKGKESVFRVADGFMS